MGTHIEGDTLQGTAVDIGEQLGIQVGDGLELGSTEDVSLELRTLREDDRLLGEGVVDA